MNNKKESTIIGLIPAAGGGSRLAPFPCPKELFPIGYQDFEVNGKKQRRPKVISQYLVEQIISAGAKKLLFVVSSGKGDIMKYYGNGSGYNVNVAYLFQQELNGMPGALDIASQWIENSLVVFGMPDTIIEPTDYFSKMMNFHKEVEADLTLGLFQTDTPSKFGMVKIDSSQNIVETIDKPKNTNLDLMWGCAIWDSKFAKLLSEFVGGHSNNGKETVLGDVFNLAIIRGLSVKGFCCNDSQYIDIGTSDELDSALKKFHL